MLGAINKCNAASPVNSESAKWMDIFIYILAWFYGNNMRVQQGKKLK